LFRINRQRPVKALVLLGQCLADDRERRPREYIAAVDALVAENAVIEQRVGAPVMNAEERTLAFAVPRQVSFAEPQMRGERREADVAADVTFRVEYRCTEAIETESAAPPQPTRSEMPPCSPSITFLRRCAQCVTACSPISMPM
jgi:hypothetical protein